MISFKELFEGSYENAAKHSAEMSKKELVMPSGAEAGDIVVYSQSKDWKSDLKSTLSGKVQARVYIFVDKKNFANIGLGGGIVVTWANDTEMKMYDFAKVISKDELEDIDPKTASKLEDTLNKLKEKGKLK